MINDSLKHQARNKAQQSIIVRRVYRQEGEFHCGICRTSYEGVKKANQCIVRCWNRLRKTTTSIELRKLGNLFHTCIYCMRTYGDKTKAHDCAVDCMSRLAIFSYDGTQLSKVKGQRKIKPVVTAEATKATMKDESSVQKPGPKVIVKTIKVPTPAKVLNATDAMNPTKDSISIEPKSQVAAVSAPAEDIAEKVKVPRDHTKKFERHGAKYVCIVCNAKYFTREDVEKCFDGHE